MTKILSLFIILLIPVTFYSNPVPPQSAADVNVRGSVAPDKIKKGRVVRASVVMDIPNGLHVQSNRPLDKFLVATKLDVEAPSGMQVGPIAYPRALVRNLNVSKKAVAVYEGRAVMRFNVTVPANYNGSSGEIRGKLRFPACNDDSCFPPGTREVKIWLNVEYLVLSDHRHQPPDFPIQLLFLAIREEKIGAAHRTQRQNVNSLWSNTNGFELLPIRGDQIDQRMTRPRRREQLRTIRKAATKRVNHIAADFVTTWPSRRADRDAQFFRACAVFVSQPPHAGDHRSRERATPTSMHCRKRTRSRIADEDRHAVRRLNSGQHTFGVAAE